MSRLTADHINVGWNDDDDDRHDGRDTNATPSERTPILSPASTRRRAASSSCNPYPTLSSYAGIAITVLTSFTYASIVTIVKYIHSAYHVPLGQMLILLVGFQALPALLGLSLRGSLLSVLFDRSMLRKHGWRLAAQGTCGALVNLLQFTAITSMQMGNAAVVFCTSPIFVALISLTFLKERITPVKFLCIAASLAGCILITESETMSPSSTLVADDSAVAQHTHEPWAFLYALCAAVLQATSLVVLRALRHVDPLVIITYYGTIGAVAYSIWAGIVFRHELVIPFDGTPSASVWPLLLLLAASLNGAANMALAHACRRENANVVGLVSSLEVVFVYIWQVAFFKEVPDWLSAAGAMLVLACVVVLGIEKGIVTTAPATSATPAPGSITSAHDEVDAGSAPSSTADSGLENERSSA